MKRKLELALLSIILILMVGGASTLAWYVFTVNGHTTTIHMAAGTSSSLQISNYEDRDFSSSIMLQEFMGTLNPVSTNRIQNGYQRAIGFDRTDEDKSIANLFARSLENDLDYYKTTIYLRTNGDREQVYLANVGFQDSDDSAPISTAIRVGFVVPSTGMEYIFAISDKENPERFYNTATGEEGYVLDALKTDGSTVPFSPLGQDNLCNFDEETGETSPKDGSVPLFTVSGNNGEFGTPVALEVYIWLEGCDGDCASNLYSTSLENLVLNFTAF